MSDHILKTIEQVQADIRKMEETIKPKKLLVNQLCEMAGIQPIYSGLNDSDASPRFTIRRNVFYGRPISTCVREFLESRESAPVKEATLDEIFSALKEGGFDVSQISTKETEQRRGLAITLAKNSQVFHRVASGDWGLMAWYPAVKEKKSKNGDTAKEESSTPVPDAASSPTETPNPAEEKAPK